MVESLHDHTLVRVVLAVDTLPQRADVGVERGPAADHLGKRRDTYLPFARVAGVQMQLSLRVRLLEDLALSRRLGQGPLVLIVREPEAPDHSRWPTQRDSPRSCPPVDRRTWRSASYRFRSAPPRSTNGGSGRAPSPAN